MISNGSHRLTRAERRSARHRRRRGPRGRIRRGLAAAAALALTTVIAPIAPSVVTPLAGATTPGSPGTPQAPTTIFTETFSNQSAAAGGISILNYVGPGGLTYTADAPSGGKPGWVPAATAPLSACNGWVMQANSPQPSTALDPACGKNNGQTQTAWSILGSIADALGQAQGQPPGNDNQILSAFTNSQNGTQNAGTQLKTANNTSIPVVPGHYYTVSEWYGAIDCFAAPPKVGFDLLSSTGSVLSSYGATVDVCNDPTAQSFGGIKVTKVASSAFQMPAGNTSVGFQVRNTVATGNGNDGGFDTPTITDVTPQLDKSFSPSTIPSGGTSTLTLTVTNTTDLAAKNDWTITDALPPGMAVASPSTVGGTCTSTSGAAYTVTAAAGSTTITANGGDLAAGQASCTITVGVTATTPATYTNGPSNITTNLNPPGPATLTVPPTCAVPPPVYTVDNGVGLTAGTSPKLISYNAAGTQLASVPLLKSDGSALGLPLGDIAISPDGTKLYGITSPLIGLTPTIYVFDATTGKATGQVPALTGVPSWLTFNPVNALSVLPDGRLLLGASTANLYAINASTGVATLYASLPAGYSSAGDFVSLPDGSLLVLANATLASTSTLFRYVAATGTFTAVGTVPQSTGLAQVGTNIYLAGTDGKLRTLATPIIPSTASGAALTTAVVSTLGSGAYAGATSVQDSAPVSCLNATKTAGAVTGPDASGKYVATYTVKVVNSGVAASYGDLTDTPKFSSNIALDSASWSGQSTGSATAPASGPFTVTLAPAGTAIAAGATHTYTVQVTFHYTDNATASPCDGTAGHGLFNAVAVPGGQETDTTDDSACIPPPGRQPNINVAKTAAAVPVTGPTAQGVFSAVYTVTVKNSGTLVGTYGALTDTPSFSSNLQMLGATWTGQSSGSATAPASGAFTFQLAPAGTVIGIGVTQMWTVTVTFKFTDATPPSPCDGTADHGLFNAVSATTGEDGSTNDNAVCVGPPPVFPVFLHKVGKDTTGATVGLAGSSWQLAFDANGAPGAVIANGVQPVAGQTGEFQMPTLPPGTYWLTETKAPAGYELLGQPIKFTVSATGAVTITSGGSGAISVGSTAGGKPEIVVGDASSLVLPYTGGAGTKAYALAGVVLLSLAGLLGVLLRRRAAHPAVPGRRVRR